MVGRCLSCVVLFFLALPVAKAEVASARPQNLWEMVSRSADPTGLANINKGDIVVKDNRIVAVGAQGKVTIPSGAKIIDVSGKTILPGYVDIHAHMWPAWGIHRSQPFEYLANLAYGVTTTRDPQTSTTDVISYEDLVETGDFVGPRILEELRACR